MTYAHRSKERDLSIIAWLVVGAIAGFIASRLVPGDEGYGVIGGLIAGIVGAMPALYSDRACTSTTWPPTSSRA